MCIVFLALHKSPHWINIMTSPMTSCGRKSNCTTGYLTCSLHISGFESQSTIYLHIAFSEQVFLSQTPVNILQLAWVRHIAVFHQENPLSCSMTSLKPPNPVMLCHNCNGCIHSYGTQSYPIVGGETSLVTSDLTQIVLGYIVLVEWPGLILWKIIP